MPYPQVGLVGLLVVVPVPLGPPWSGVPCSLGLVPIDWFGILPLAGCGVPRSSLVVVSCWAVATRWGVVAVAPSSACGQECGQWAGRGCGGSPLWCCGHECGHKGREGRGGSPLWCCGHKGRGKCGGCLTEPVGTLLCVGGGTGVGLSLCSGSLSVHLQELCFFTLFSALRPRH